MIRRFLLLGFLVALPVALVAGDLYARNYAENQLQQRISVDVPQARNVSVTISSFPFLWHLLTSGRISEVSAHAGPVADGRITFDRIDVSLRGVRLDRTVLARERRVRLLSIDGGQVSADITAAELSQALGGVPISLSGDHVEATLRGQRIVANVSLVHDELRLQAAGFPLITLQIPTNGMLPCAASVVLAAGHLTVACQVTRVPPALLEAAYRLSA